MRNIVTLSQLDLTPEAREVLGYAKWAKQGISRMKAEGKDSGPQYHHVLGEYSGYVRVFSLLSGVRSYLNVHQIIDEAIAFEVKVPASK